MAGKKIWAYAKDKRSNDYVAGTKHKHKLYYVWEAVKMQNTNPAIFSQLEFMSTQRLVNDRRKMHVHAGGFFRYNPNQSPKGISDTDPDSDSLSHSLAIAALAELEKLNFECRGEKFSISPTSVETEQRLQLISEGEYKYYIPDIVFTFDQDSEYAKRWGRKLVIEVMHTHACEEVKIKDFENHCIPIIEVKLNKMTLEEHSGTRSPNIQQIEEFYDYLKRKFSNVIYGNILSNPVTTEFYKDNVAIAFEKQKLAEKQRDRALQEVTQLQNFEKKLRKLTSEYSDLKLSASAEVKEITNLKNAKIIEIENIMRQLHETQHQLSKTNKRLKEVEAQLETEVKKGFWDKLLGRWTKMLS